jgi:pimeloyl-ACP methyl ester carboxylesterase
MTLEVLSRLPEKATEKPPLLFVHGAWLAAWCWDEYFLPFFAGRGYPAYALSLRGHGKSPGVLNAAGMADYVADLAEAVAALPAPPVLIGHSMGGGIVQKYLETREASGAVLLGSMPPQGMSAAFLDAWRRHPLRWLQANFSMSSKNLFDTPELCREFFFSAATPEPDIVRFMGKMNEESYRALFDMTLPNLAGPGKVTTPVLVLGGEKDVVIPPRDAQATARRYQTQASILPGLPHAMMLDARWRGAADGIEQWLAGRYG